MSGTEMRPERRLDEKHLENSAELRSDSAPVPPVLKEIVDSVESNGFKPTGATSGTESVPEAIAKPPSKQLVQMQLTGLVLILVLCLCYGNSVAVTRAQATVTMTALLAPNSPERLDVLVDLAEAYQTAGEHSKADEIYAGLLLSMSAEYPVGDMRKVYLQLLSARSKANSGDLKQAASLCEGALSHIGDVTKLKSSDCPRGVTSLLCQLADTFDPQEVGKHIDTTLPLLANAVALWSVCPGTDTKSNTEAKLASLYELKNDRAKALEHWVSAYRAYKYTGNTDYNIHRLTHMGLNLVELGRDAEAEPILEKALAMNTEKRMSGSWGGAIPANEYDLTLNYCLGRTKLQSGKYADAMRFFDLSMNQMQERDDGTYWAMAKFYKGKCCAAMGDKKQARQLFVKVLNLLKENYDGPTVEQVNGELKRL